ESKDQKFMLKSNGLIWKDASNVCILLSVCPARGQAQSRVRSRSRSGVPEAERNARGSGQVPAAAKVDSGENGAGKRRGAASGRRRAEHQHRVEAAERERVRHRVVHALLAPKVGHVVEI